MKADLAVRTIRVGEHEVRMPPGWDAHLDEYQIRGRDVFTLIEVTQPNENFSIPNSEDPAATQAASFSIYSDHLSNERAVAIELLASVLALTLHECLEWITVDETPLAAAHVQSELNWEWGMNRCRNLVKAYIREFPLEDPNG